MHQLPPLSPGVVTHPATSDVLGSSKRLPMSSVTPSPRNLSAAVGHSPGAFVGAASDLGQHQTSPPSPAAHGQPLTRINSPPITHGKALNHSSLTPAVHCQPPSLTSTAHSQPKKLQLHGSSFSPVTQSITKVCTYNT